ncbi:MAG: ribosome maturation factor RimP [Solirubrobacteraceae bacterium]
MAEPKNTTPIQATVEASVLDAVPNVEVVLAEVVGGGTLRVVIDHPQGVSLELCEQVSRSLEALREEYALEVSSPGRDRPLTRPEHFRRFVGSRVRVRTSAPFPVPDGEEPRRSFTGELVGADDAGVTLAADEGIVAIPYADIHRSNLVEE